MTLDYFYGNQADQFTFYRIPKVLFTDERFKPISAEAKILYGILLDRMGLSMKNNWLDDRGRVFIIFTLEEVMEAIGCADQKATKLLTELESKAGLIERKRQGQGKPSLIFVKNFVDNSGDNLTGSSESRIKTRENHDSRTVENTTPESRKSRGSNTDKNKNDFNETDTYPFLSETEPYHEPDQAGLDMDERNKYRAFLEEQLEYDILLENHPYKYVNGQSIKYTVTPILGEHQKNNPKLVYCLDFEVTPHLLRHTYITNLLYAGVDPKTVQYLAGHENSKTTMDIYAKVKYNKPEQLSSVVNAAFNQYVET